jgi:hypothetical protein
MIGALVTQDSDCISALMARGFSPGDGRVDLAAGDFLPFKAELLADGLRPARLGVATSLHSTVGRQIGELTALGTEVELYLATPLDSDTITPKD